MNREDFKKNKIIAQRDSGGYDPSGWIAWVDGDRAYLSSFGTCSCYSSFTALCGGGVNDSIEEGDPSFDWEGSVRELLDMAMLCLDPSMPQRFVNLDDFDAEYLIEVYKDVLLWAMEKYSVPLFYKNCMVGMLDNWRRERGACSDYFQEYVIPFIVERMNHVASSSVCFLDSVPGI